MKAVIRTGLCKCYMCGARNPQLWRSAANKFSVRCSAPGCAGKTRWLSKEDALVEWFNLFLYGKAKTAFVRSMVNNNKRLREENTTEIEAKNFKGYDPHDVTRQI